MAAKGVIESEGGTAVQPVGPVRVTVGGSSFLLPDKDVKYSIITKKLAFKFNAKNLTATGVPVTGPSAPTVYRMPVMVEVPVTGGKQMFETIIELKRNVPTSKNWKR